jgi:hypothetical protein
LNNSLIEFKSKTIKNLRNLINIKPSAIGTSFILMPIMDYPIQDPIACDFMLYMALHF